MERTDSLSDETLSQKDKRDILDIISSTKAELLSQEGLMFDGDPASPEAIESILSAMEWICRCKCKYNFPRWKSYRKGSIRFKINYIILILQNPDIATIEL